MKFQLCARQIIWLHCNMCRVHAPKERCTHRSSSDTPWLHLAVTACSRALVSHCGRRALAHLAVSIVLQSSEPEANIADIAAWVEICKRCDSSRLPVVTLQRRQPSVPTAASRHMSELPKHCMPCTPSRPVQRSAASMATSGPVADLQAYH